MLDRFLRTFLTLVIGIAVSSSAVAKSSQDRAFEKLVDDHWQWLMESFPTWATSVGGYDHLNDRWTDYSSKAIQSRKDYTKNLVTRLKKIKRANLTGQNSLSYDLMLYQQEIYVEGQAFPSELMPLNQMGGVQQNVARTLAVMPKRSPRDFENMIHRLNRVPRLVDQTIALMAEGLDKGITPPKVTLRDIPQQIANLMETNPDKNSILTPFHDLPKTIPSDKRKRLKEAANEALAKSVLPAYRKLHEFMVKRYLPGARESIATADLPSGQAWYAYAVRENTTTEMTPQQVHDLGQSEVKRIKAEMERVIKEAKFKGGFKAFTEFLRKDARFYYDKPEELIAGYRNIAKRADYELFKLFGHLPRQPYGVVAVPFYAEKSQTTAYYRPGSAKDGRPGTFFANTYDLKSRPKWEMEALTLHEAVPGHHLQIAIAQEQDELPMFRRNSGYTAFVEGWGLYAESLGEEMGFYRDPYAKFGQLSYEMWRAIRLVVDTGMHSLGWSRQKAIDFFTAHTGKPAHDIVVEIDRYIVWPGQALAYKVGELRIKELRRRATKQLGDRFDVRQFHDEVLKDGSVPLAVLEAKIDRWVAGQKMGH